MYAKLIGNQVIYAPRNLKLDDGTIIVNFNKNINILKEYGYKEIIDNPISYDKDTQKIILTGYTETEDNLIANYRVEEITKPVPLTLNDRVSKLEAQIYEQAAILNEEVNK